MRAKWVYTRTLLSVCWIGWFTTFFNRLAVSPVLPLIEEEFHLSHAQASILMSSNLLAYALMQIPAGVISDKFGRRTMIVVGILFSSIANSFVSLGISFAQMALCRTLAGLGAGTYYSSSFSLVSDAYPHGKRSKAFGIALSGTGAGSVAAAIAGGFLADFLSWNTVFYLSILLGTLSAFLFLRYVKEVDSPDSRRRSHQRMGDYRSLLRSRILVCLCIIHLLVLAAYFSLMTFIPTYLTKAAGLSVSFANIVFLALPTAEMFAGPILGSIAERIGKETVIITSLIASMLIATILPYTSLLTLLFLCLLALGFTLRGALITLTAFVADASLAPLVGTALGCYNLVGFLGSTLGPPVFGFLVDSMGFSVGFLFVTVSIGLSIPLTIMTRNLAHGKRAPEK